MFQRVILILLLPLMLFAKESCVDCHQEQSAKCEKSVHYTLSNAINLTRQTWGITDSNVTLQSIPLPKTQIEKLADLVDDFLRRKCLKCHPFNRSSGERGMKRGIGCLSCHTPHQPEGSCQRSSKIAMKKCLSCHNKGFVGGDYKGLFPKDHHRSYRAPLSQNGHFPSQKYGIDHHTLVSDIHYQKGLKCADCHKAEEMQGGTKASCTDCHANPSLANHPDHHNKLTCTSCHASWNYTAYELSVFRDDTADYSKWKDLTLQEDGYLSNFLTKALKAKKPPKPRMPDWIERKQAEGIWYSGYRYKRWEHFVLANYDDSRIGIVRPLFQYRISYRDRNGTMILDDVRTIDGKPIEAWIPHTPHTITKKAKSCESCHANPLIMKPYTGRNEILKLQVPQNMIGASPLSSEQIEKMRSLKYKRVRGKMLLQP
jgi:hypothetical protein